MIPATNPNTITPPLTVIDMPIHAHWQETATAKSFKIIARVDDRYHLLLRCQSCGQDHRSKLYVLMNNQPECPHCIENNRRDDAKAAGLILLERDPDDRHYAYYLAPCGHRLRRQFELVERFADGNCAPRCEECHQQKEEAEATRQNWSLISPAADRGPNYRLYQHHCGHRQTIARVNMQTGRFNCEACGEGWASAQSYIYCMRFEFPGADPVVKLGFSRNPHSRLHYQLKGHPDLSGEILQSIPIQTGHTALCLEKKMHAKLNRDYPDSIASPEVYAPWLRVKSEIYTASLQSVILDMLDHCPDH